MKKVFCLIIILPLFLISCKTNTEVNMESKNNKVSEDNVDNKEIQSVSESSIVEERKFETTCKMEELSLNKDSSDFVYSYDTMDNNNGTTTIIPCMYNNTTDAVSNFILEYKFIKNNEVVYSMENQINESINGNGGFLGMAVFLAEISITDFDSIEITMKK